jgi:hypothetical protein
MVEHSLRVFEKRVPRGIFVPERKKVITGGRKLHNEAVQSLYCSVITV